jgi:signal transduction histidine kinase
VTGHFWRDRLLEQALVVPAAVVLVVLRHEGWLADVPIGVMLAVLWGSYLVATTAGQLWPDSAPQSALWWRCGFTMSAATAAIYLTGWGPALAVGYVAIIADTLRQCGSRAVRPALTWAFVGLVGGQVAIALHWAPTEIRRPLVHGVALMSAVALVPCMVLLAITMRRREDSEESATRLLDLAHDLAQPAPLAEVCQRLADAVPRLVGFDRAAVLVYEPRGELIRMVAASGYNAEEAAGLLGREVRPDDTPLLRDMVADPGFRYFRTDQVDDPYTRASMEAAGSVELVCVPIVSGNQLLGAIAADNTTRPLRGMGGVVVDRLAGLAAQAAIALENGRLLEQERATMAELRKTDEQKSEFLAVVSHELRTPLSVMMGAARTLQWRGDDIPAGMRGELIESVVRRGEQLNRLVDDLLQASGDVKLETAPVDVGSIARMAVADAAAYYRDRHLRSSANGAGPPIVVRADAFRVRQVIDNLLNNAVKYAPEGVTTVEVTWSGNDALLCVADSGPGMDEDHAEHAFDPFYQADSSAVREVGGLGLGLHICRRIVEAHGGHIWLESQPGRGTRVKFTLPAGGPPES